MFRERLRKGEASPVAPVVPRSRGESGGRAGGKSRSSGTRCLKVTSWLRNSNPIRREGASDRVDGALRRALLVSAHPCAYFSRELHERQHRMFFLNGDQHEKEKRHPRLLEEKERAAASVVVGDGGPHQAPATRAASGAAGASGKAARDLDEIGTPRIVVGPPRIVGPLSIATASPCQSLSG